MDWGDALRRLPQPTEYVEWVCNIHGCGKRWVSPTAATTGKPRREHLDEQIYEGRLAFLAHIAEAHPGLEEHDVKVNTKIERPKK